MNFRDYTYIHVYIYIVYFVAFKFKANCLGECSYVSRGYPNYVLCSREPLSGMTSGSGAALQFQIQQTGGRS